VVDTIPQPLFSLKRDQVPIIQKVRWTPGLFWGVRITPLRVEQRTVQPVVSVYMDYAILTH
jgi:hypothetical protein